MKSLLVLMFGVLNKDFFELAISKEHRILLKMVILDVHFPERKIIYTKKINLPKYFSEIEAQVLEERQADYKIITRTSEGFVRDWKFKYSVLNAYNNTCCISSYYAEPNHSIVEACHIEDHSKTGINTITNGIVLSILLHRAFDNGAISISDDYKVLVKTKKDFKEGKSPYQIRQFEGKHILLPNNEIFYPNLERLAWHRKEFGF